MRGVHKILEQLQLFLELITTLFLMKKVTVYTLTMIQVV